jgi:hypothetical protein
MENIHHRPVYDLTLSELFAIAALVGGAHYVASLIGNVSSASSFDHVINSANVGLTAAVGVLVYCTYRYFRPGPNA